MIMNKLTKYIIPKSIENYIGYDAIEKRYESRLISFSCITMFFISIILSIIVFRQHGTIAIDNVGIILMLPLSVLALYQYVKHDKMLLYQITILTLQYIHLNIRSTSLDSRAWLLLPWAYIAYIIVCYTVGFKKALAGLILNTAVISYHTYAGTKYAEDTTFESQIIINILVPAIVYTLILLYKHIVEVKRDMETAEFQKREVISKMILRLSNDINNPLTISKLCLNRLRKEYKQNLVERCEHNIDRIATIINIIKNVRSIDDVENGINLEALSIFEEVHSTSSNS